MALRQSHYLGILLSVSLAVNLFAAGAFFGGSFAQREASGSGVGFSGLVAALPDSVRDEARTALAVREADMRLRLEALQEARAAAEIALIADPFFAESFDAELADVRARGSDVQAALHEVLIEMAAGLDGADRAVLAELLFTGRGELRLAERAGTTTLAGLAPSERR